MDLLSDAGSIYLIYIGTEWSKRHMHYSEPCDHFLLHGKIFNYNAFLYTVRRGSQIALLGWTFIIPVAFYKSNNLPEVGFDR